MSHASRLPEQRRRTAAEWFLEIYQSQDPSPQTLQEWHRWMEESRDNRLAFKAMEEAWHLIPGHTINCSAADVDDDYDPTKSVEEWLQQKRISAQRQRSGTYLHKHLRAIAASALLMLGGFAGFHEYRVLRMSHSHGDFATHTAEQLELTLSDGSRVTLGARSYLRLDLGQRARDLWLEGGEAYFTVARDSNRPFRVHTTHGIVTAISTEFNVRAAEDHVTVAVTEGAVKVSREHLQAASQSAVRQDVADVKLVRRGQQVTLRFASEKLANGEILTRGVDPKELARWRDGWFVYHNEPLEDVIADVSRYTSRPIHLDGASLGELRFTGVVSKDHIVEWVKGLATVFPVTVQDDSDTLTVSGSGR